MRKFQRVLALAAACAVHAGAIACDRSPLLIRGVDVWTPQGIERERDVLISLGRIESVTRAGDSAPAGLRVVNGQGTTMLPGLIDSHMHFGLPGSRDRAPNDHPWGDAAITGRQLLRAGVTSGRVHLSEIRSGAVLRRDSQDDCAPLPRVQSGGPGFIPDASPGDQHPAWSVTSVDDAIAKVRREKDSGFDWIAIHDAHKFRPSELDAIVSTARSLGLRILGSGYTAEEVRSSLVLRPDTIDYISVSPEPEYDPELLRAAREQQQLTFVPRLGVHERWHSWTANPQLIDEPLLYEFMPDDVAARVRSAVSKRLATRDDEYAQRMQTSYPTIRRKFSQLRASGIPLAMSTDSDLPRDAIWRELRAWRDYGVPVDEALLAATASGARVLGDPSVGHLNPGARADFILYRGNLAAGELEPSGVSTVAKGGVLYVLNGSWVGPTP